MNTDLTSAQDVQHLTTVNTSDVSNPDKCPNHVNQALIRAS